MNRVKSFLRNNLVPLIFFGISGILMVLADLKVRNVSADVMERVFRNLFLVLSLIIPIVAGLGLNFGIVLGAMAGQIGLMIVQDGQTGSMIFESEAVARVANLVVAVICSIPIAMLLGYLTGLLFNRTRGREMITGIILGFFANGISQFLFLVLAGTVLMPFSDTKNVVLPQGIGIRVTINLTSVEKALDEFPLGERADGRPRTASIPLNFEVEEADPNKPGETRVRKVHYGLIPIATILVNVLLCIGLWWFFRTRLGQHLRAVGQDAHVAEIAGIAVNRCRIIAIILSMVLAGIGQIIFLQNMRVMNTFQQHEQVGFYAIAALLVGGATTRRATIGNAIAGTFLFHLLIVAVALAAPILLHNAQVGEYLREFTVYAIIGFTLAIHAWKARQHSISTPD